MKTYSAITVANYFVDRAIQEGSPITQMKVQKMVYFAHGVHLAMFGQPLVKETFQAWKFGPVVPVIYENYKFYGSAPIVTLDKAIEDDSMEILLNDDEVCQSLNTTWNITSKVSPIALSSWTHIAGGPWEEVYIENVPEIRISNESIEKFFRVFLRIENQPVKST